MTAKEGLHKLVDELRESQLAEARQLLEALRDSAVGVDDEPLTEEDLASIERGLADVRAGRVKSLEDYERERGL
jgi:hypothetical protein